MSKYTEFRPVGAELVHADRRRDRQTDRHDEFFFVLLTVHLSINLVNDQLEAQFFYFIIRLLQFSTCFEQRRVHHQEVKLY